MVGRRRAYYSAADDYTLRLFWHRAEAPRVHSQSVQHGCTAGWVCRLSAELLAQLIAAGIIERVEISAASLIDLAVYSTRLLPSFTVS